jgi:cysteinyl-tRNA synthetase
MKLTVVFFSGNDTCQAYAFRIHDFSRLVESSLKNNFHWSTVVQSVFVDFADQLTAYTNQRGHSAHPLVLMHAIDELQSLVGLFGFKQQQESCARIEASAMIDEAVQFRGQIRALALKQLEGGSNDIAEQTLRLCDEYRHILANSGVMVQVRVASCSLILLLLGR